MNDARNRKRDPGGVLHGRAYLILRLVNPILLHKLPEAEMERGRASERAMNRAGISLTTNAGEDACSDDDEEEDDDERSFVARRGK